MSDKLPDNLGKLILPDLETLSNVSGMPSLEETALVPSVNVKPSSVKLPDLDSAQPQVEQNNNVFPFDEMPDEYDALPPEDFVDCDDEADGTFAHLLMDPDEELKSLPEDPILEPQAEVELDNEAEPLPEKKPKEGKIKKRKSSKNIIVQLHQKIGDGMFSWWQTVCKLTQKLKPIAIMLKAITPVVRFLCKIWSLCILVFFVLTFVSFKDIKPNANQILKLKDTTIKVGEYRTDGDIVASVTNTGTMYADFMLQASPKGFGKKEVLCISEVTLISIGETKDVTLYCSSPVQKAKFSVDPDYPFIDIKNKN